MTNLRPKEERRSHIGSASFLIDDICRIPFCRVSVMREIPVPPEHSREEHQESGETHRAIDGSDPPVRISAFQKNYILIGVGTHKDFHFVSIPHVLYQGVRNGNVLLLNDRTIVHLNKETHIRVLHFRAIGQIELSNLRHRRDALSVRVAYVQGYKRLVDREKKQDARHQPEKTGNDMDGGSLHG